ncbi:shikimate dehydrogenase [Porticoccus sp. W117]|uniref:shikimate dehydrogenase n=1 Tax=Porticoccus sp. W117 TaxID=3054777 RepID=UPI00259A4706|nr:shikimate dehydrogenase [Porticoccus sp. W117]MDM3870830.1 shikimate dehydrogenase [Porticoccus sp. W117]
MTDQYAVFGNPIGHSKSPLIHSAFAAQTGQDMEYRAQLVPEDEFQAYAERFFNGGGCGLNITVPFKQQACELADTLSERACRAAAVNTLMRQPDGSLLGDNTDGVGMVTDMLNNLGWQLAGKRILVLGAGGAVRGVLQPLLACSPSRLVIANRTVHKAEQLAADFAELGNTLGCGFESLAGETFDLVINGTSASLSGQLPPLPENLLAPDSCCYDMMYASEPTVFMTWASEHGAAKVADGLGMLVEQAAEAFALWRNLRPNTAGVIRQLRGQ